MSFSISLDPVVAGASVSSAVGTLALACAGLRNPPLTRRHLTETDHVSH